MPSNQNKNPQEMMAKTVKRHSNDNASAGGLAGLFILFCVCSLFTAFLAPVVDKTTETNNAMIGTPGLPMSQERIDTLETLSDAFAAMAFVILIALGLNFWVASIRDQSS